MNPRLSLRNLAIALVISILFSSVGLPVKTNGASNPLAAFTYESCVACVPPGDVVSFNGNWSTSGASIVSYVWDFGDGSPPVKTSSPMTTHLYGGAPAKWQVTLTVQDSAGLTDTTSQLVLFETVPRYTFQPTNPVVGQQVTFNASDSISYNSTNPIKGYDWSFGDGTSGTGAIITHSYSAGSSYRIVLTLLTSYGNPSVSKTLTVGMLDWKQVNQQGQPVPPGSYTITGVIHYESPYQTTPVASKTIMIQAPDFQLTVSPASVVMAKGSTTTLTITVTAVNGFTGTINLSATIQPANKHPPTLAPINSVTLTAANPTGTTSLTITSTRSTNSGTYTVTITGTSGTISHTITSTVTIASK